MIWDCPNSSRTAQKVRLGMWAVVEKSRRNRGIGLSMIIKSSTVSSLYGILTNLFCFCTLLVNFAEHIKHKKLILREYNQSILV